MDGIESKSGDGVAISPVTVGGSSSSGGEVAGGDLLGNGLEGERGMGEELRRVKKIVDPKMPTKSEKEGHELAGHLPFRSWC